MLRITCSLSLAAALAAIAPMAAAQPPAADALFRLAEEVAAVTGAGPEAKLMLSETRFGVASQRTIGIGDEYLDGWRVAEIAPGAVTLTKGTARRTVALTGGKAAPTAAAPLATVPEEVAATNAVEGAKGSPAAIQAAVAAGDIRKTFDLGGSAKDVASAFAVKSQPLRDFLAQGPDARYTNTNGRLGVHMSLPAEPGGGMRRTATIYPAELNGVTPPPEASRAYLAGDWISIDAEGNTVMDVSRMPIPPGAVPPPPQPPRTGGVNFGFSTTPRPANVPPM